MTRTQFVYSRHDALWAYDVALGIFLKHLIDAAEASAQAKTPWLRRWVSKWRQVACISEYGLTSRQRMVRASAANLHRPGRAGMCKAGDTTIHPGRGDRRLAQ
jgi:hypothetical protein